MYIYENFNDNMFNAFYSVVTVSTSIVFVLFQYFYYYKQHNFNVDL